MGIAGKDIARQRVRAAENISAGAAGHQNSLKGIGRRVRTGGINPQPAAGDGVVGGIGIQQRQAVPIEAAERNMLDLVAGGINQEGVRRKCFGMICEASTKMRGWPVKPGCVEPSMTMPLAANGGKWPVRWMLKTPLL